MPRTCAEQFAQGCDEFSGNETFKRIAITIYSYCYPKLLAYLLATKI